jgi:hypothetical protein
VISAIGKPLTFMVVVWLVVAAFMVFDAVKVEEIDPTLIVWTVCEDVVVVIVPVYGAECNLCGGGQGSSWQYP